MPNLAATLKDEIRRLARKEIKLQMGATRRAAVQHRREIARLKKLIVDLERRLAAVRASSARAQSADEESDEVPPGARFSARSVRAQRKRLKLSAAQFGRLVGVTGQTIYLWEQGKTRPGKAQFMKLIEVRSIGRREAVRRLEALED